MGGIARAHEIVAATSRQALEDAVAEGELVRLARGRYAVPELDEARQAAARLHGAASHLSAALLHGWKVKAPPARPCVTVARQRSRVQAGTADVRYGRLTREELESKVTAPMHTVIDCARSLPFDAALAVADSALRSRKVTRAGLVAAALDSPRTGRPAAVRVARAASGKAANPFESVLRAIALDVPGLTVVAQGPVELIGHADLTDPSLKIAIEADSFEHHALPEAFKYDVRRYTAMVRQGWLVVRFVWDDVMHRQDEVRAILGDVVRMRAAQQAVGGVPATAQA